jgi:hypothetical protein
VLSEISKKDEPEVKKDEPTIQEIEDPLPKVREVISNIKNIESNMNVGQSMGNARRLAEFNKYGWIQVDFAPLINYRREEESRHVAKLVEDIFDQEMSGESIQKVFEEEREEMMKDGSTDFTTQRFMMKKEKSTTVMSLVTRRIHGRRYDSS